MCGINGIFSISHISEIEKRITSMNKSIIHRGPDFTNHKIFDNSKVFGHNRLKIIDLSDSSNQPMTDEDNSVSIVFNGEIYNFNEIRKELDYDFKSKGDTEVILAAYVKNGIDWFLDRANGMFAFVIYDKKLEKLILARDRFGIKPLFYFFKENLFIFSSEIKGILNSGLVEPQFNKKAIDVYLGNRYIFEPYTFFSDIYQLEKSTFMLIDLKNSFRSKKIKYWNLPELNFCTDYDEPALLEQLDYEITKSVKKRLLSDVPLGTYLSGGVDSGLITAIAALSKNESINTYTIGFKEEKFNEFENSDIVSKKYATLHQKIIVGFEDYMGKWLDLIDFKDAPLSVPNEVPLSIMSSKLKENITVVLSGEGADELFAGYGKIFRLPFFVKNTHKNFHEEFINEYEYVPRKIREKYLNLDKDYRDEFDTKNKDLFFGLKDEEKVFKFFHKRHIQGLLSRLDLATMHTSVEGRVPFLDHELIEFVYKKIPYDLKLKWKSEQHRKKCCFMNPAEYSEISDTPKYLLKKLSERYLPKDIINQKKIGFPVPLNEWYPEMLKIFKLLLLESEWFKSGITGELYRDLHKQERFGQILWMMINIELFKERYFKKSWRW